MAKSKNCKSWLECSFVLVLSSSFKCSVPIPGGYFEIRRSGGLGPHIKFGGKIWGKVRPSSPKKGKNLGRSVTTRCKSWGKVPILGSYLKFGGQNLGYLSLIFLEARFGAPTRISEANFGAKPLTSKSGSTPPGVPISCFYAEYELDARH